jgi:hypothetical protein
MRFSAPHHHRRAAQQGSMTWAAGPGLVTYAKDSTRVRRRGGQARLDRGRLGPFCREPALLDRNRSQERRRRTGHPSPPET